MIRSNRKWMFPGGKRKALTLSYDDGVLQDERLIQLLRKHHLKGTFNINSGLLGKTGMHRGVDHSCLKPEKIREVYEGFEVAMHTCTHIKMGEVDDQTLLREVQEDRNVLEKLVGYPIQGLAYPSGSYNLHVMEKLKEMNVNYARVTRETESFFLPENLLEWAGTCRHTNPRWFSLTEQFLKPEAEGLLFLWGHSYEFDICHNWEQMEEFCKMVANREDIWYASNAEVAAWIKECRWRELL